MPGNGDISRKREDGRAQAGEQVGELSTADVGDLGGAQVRHVAGGQDLIPKTPLGPDQEALSLQGFALPFGEAQALVLSVQRQLVSSQAQFPNPTWPHPMTARHSARAAERRSL
jgi:hypothetical protein